MHRIIFDKSDEANVSQRKKKGLFFHGDLCGRDLHGSDPQLERDFGREIKEVMIGVIIALDVCQYGRFFLFEDGAVPQGG